jgi:hypothetical protein
MSSRECRLLALVYPDDSCRGVSQDSNVLNAVASNGLNLIDCQLVYLPADQDATRMYSVGYRPKHRNHLDFFLTKHHNVFEL